MCLTINILKTEKTEKSEIFDYFILFEIQNINMYISIKSTALISIEKFEILPRSGHLTSLSDWGRRTFSAALHQSGLFGRVARPKVTRRALRP